MTSLADNGEPLLPSTRRALLHRLAIAQREGRAPSLTACVARGGDVVWSGSRTAMPGPAPDERTQYRIGSITKTFTAVLVMRLRDEGLLDLSDRLGEHLPGTGADDVTVRQLLSHTAGLAAETPAPWWERTPASLRPALADTLGQTPLVHPPGRVHHYSNPGYALLGALVAKVRGVPWESALREEVLAPLGLTRTTARPSEPHARGWAVHPWADVTQPEPCEDLGVMAPAGQLWSTSGDLARFGSFLLTGDARVLGAESVREMRTAAAPAEPGEEGSAYGLGTQLVRADGRTLVGHGGSLPGFVAGLWASEADDLVAVALANCTSGPSTGALAAALVGVVAEAEPPIPAPWRPLPDLEPALLELAGPWYWGTQVVAVRPAADGGLEVRPLGGAGRGARFRARGDGTWLGLDGYYAGEVLRIARRPDGSVSHLDIGSFVLTRLPYDDADAEAVPGGVAPEGWRGVP